ncbi:PsiF family protein [Gayadomonas joobiniege]|uniref:PsiF family protein n=1 Tax=Gayadomonas joobiniege TaxID=1234606 RepID=UPI000372F108|nr:PsiF family protein [Gayadomonas joobiniege]
MKKGIILASVIALSLSSVAVQAKPSKEERQAARETCKAQAKEQKVAKDERKEWMKSCVKSSLQKSAESE